MIELIKELVSIDGTSGDEKAVRDAIIEKIAPFCDYRVDALGNLIASKKGKKDPGKKIMLDAHMDEVGIIITGITANGFLRFKALGGINTSALMFKTVRINGKIPGVISGKPLHLTRGDEEKKLPDPENLYIDIGAQSGEDAGRFVNTGDRGVMVSDFTVCGKNVISKALDDRVLRWPQPHTAPPPAAIFVMRIGSLFPLRAFFEAR